MEILIAIGLILVTMFLMRSVSRLLPFKICVICAGVSGAWLLLTAGVLVGFFDLESYRGIIALLMGGTVIGVIYQGEKRFEWAKDNIMKFKILIMLVGFLLADYAISFMSWFVFGVEVGVLGTILYVYFIMPAKVAKNTTTSPRVKEIEEKLKNCC